MTITRRALIGGATAGLLVPRSSLAQSSIYGRIAFVQDGNIMQWSSGVTAMLHEDGTAMSPSWRPGSNMMMYVRDGGSYSNLISLDTETGRTKRLTDSESSFDRGSQDYVYDCDWINDVFWSESGVIAFASNAAPSQGELNLWILDYDDLSVYQAANDYTVAGHVEKTTVDASGKYAAYTVLGDNQRSSFVYLRNLDSGATTSVMGPNAYDGAVSPNGRWVVGSIRDEKDRSDLWIWNRETGNLNQLTHGEQASNPTWDPFGEAITWVSYIGEGFSLRAGYVDFNGSSPQLTGEPIVLVQRANIDTNSRPSWNSPE